MDPSDRPGPLSDGAACTASGAPVPTARIRILATRDDLAFVELVCDGCGSAALALLMDADGSGGGPLLDVAVDGLSAAARSGPTGRARPIDADDVEALRRDLAAWRGGLVGWLAAIERPERGSAREW